MMEKSSEFLTPSEHSEDNETKTWKRIRIFKTVMLVFPFVAMVSLKLNKNKIKKDSTYGYRCMYKHLSEK